MVSKKSTELKQVFELNYPTGSRPDILTRLFFDPKDLLQVTNPEITVITPSFNTGKFLEDTIRSVANQTFRNFEHLVIDGGSTDETLEILKKYPHVKWVSEKDNGAPEAFRKGLKMAKGKYIMECCVSDGYANKNWLKYCSEFLNNNPDVSLVWGVPQTLSEEGIAGSIGFPQFHEVAIPQKYDFFIFWLITSGPGLPEMSLCTTKEIVDLCYPISNEESNSYKFLDWAEFTYNFHRLGYLAYGLPVVATFSRFHENQLGLRIKQAGLLKAANKNYQDKWRNFRNSIIFKGPSFSFIDRDGKKLDVVFRSKDFFKQYFLYIFSKRYWKLKFNYHFGRVKKIPRKFKEKFLK